MMVKQTLSNDQTATENFHLTLSFFQGQNRIRSYDIRVIIKIETQQLEAS